MDTIGRINCELSPGTGQPANQPLFIFSPGAQISFGPVNPQRQIEEINVTLDEERIERERREEREQQERRERKAR
jgi:hypothetical protein